MMVVACKLGPELYEVPPFCPVSATLERFRNPSCQTSFDMRGAAFDTHDTAVHAGCAAASADRVNLSLYTNK